MFYAGFYHHCFSFILQSSCLDDDKCISFQNPYNSGTLVCSGPYALFWSL